ncbi:hypothetical protein N7492_000701 [Penicillium capsulatum]|uniref:Uncharacterized protein n=1 Tax=Penicillium capsulatum TaxID=69766 RepID=A0A9W9LZ78_9EURO|nr:hypothetical protein N7492_000701 [Penicillium capsulatum]
MIAAAIPTLDLNKRLDLKDSCKPYAHIIADAVGTIKLMGTAAADAIDEALAGANTVLAARAEPMIPRIFGIDLRYTPQLRKLSNSFRVIGDPDNNDVPILCDPDIIHEKRGQESYTGNNPPDNLMAQWSPVFNAWIFVDKGITEMCPPLREGRHMPFRFASKPDERRELILLCPRIFQNWRREKQLSYAKEHQDEVKQNGTLLADYHQTPTRVLFHELGHSLKAGRAVDTKIYHNGALKGVYGMHLVTRLSKISPARALTNADSWTYFAMAMLLDEWYWFSGKPRTPPC